MSSGNFLNDVVRFEDTKDCGECRDDKSLVNELNIGFLELKKNIILIFVFYWI